MIFKRIIISIILIISTLISKATICESQFDGDWSDLGMWSCGTPIGGDTIIINHHITITNPNLTIDGDSTVIILNDTLLFDGGKLKIGCGSSIEIKSDGLVTSDDNGNNEKITICNTQVWSSNDGDLSGSLLITEVDKIPMFIENKPLINQYKPQLINEYYYVYINNKYFFKIDINSNTKIHIYNISGVLIVEKNIQQDNNIFLNKNYIYIIIILNIEEKIINKYLYR